MNIARPSQNQAAIVGPQYCSPYQTDITIKKKSAFSSPYRFVVTDANNNIIFDVKPASTFSDKKVIFDAAGNPILTLSRSFFSSTWKAYRGESSDEKDVIFSVKSSSIFHPKTIFNVYMANNNSSRQVPDFKVKGKMYKKASMAIYAGESSTIVAQVQNKLDDLESSGKKTVVTVHTNIDQAFVVAMLVLLTTLLVSSRNSASAANAAAMNAGASMPPPPPPPGF